MYMQGTPIASGGTVALSTADSTNQIDPTYDYINAGTLHLYARGSVGAPTTAVLANLFVSGIQICRRLPVPFFGTTGGLSTSDHLVCSARTLGGRVVLTFAAVSATPTVDFLLTFEGVPFGGALSRLFGRR